VTKLIVFLTVLPPGVSPSSTYCETKFCDNRFPPERFGRLVVFKNCFQAELGFGLENWRTVSAGLLIVLALAVFAVYAV
jgi:hypothetical protein